MNDRLSVVGVQEVQEGDGGQWGRGGDQEDIEGCYVVDFFITTVSSPEGPRWVLKPDTRKTRSHAPTIYQNYRGDPGGFPLRRPFTSLSVVEGISRTRGHSRTGV